MSGNVSDAQEGSGPLSVPSGTGIKMTQWPVCGRTKCVLNREGKQFPVASEEKSLEVGHISRDEWLDLKMDAREPEEQGTVK